MSDAPTISQIAADVRRLAPERFPVGFNLEDRTDRIWFTSSRGTYPAPVEIASLAMIGAMVLACSPERTADVLGPIWHVFRENSNGNYDLITTADRDHGDDPLLSLYAAFLWAKGGAA